MSHIQYTLEVIWMRRSGNETEVNWSIGSLKILSLVFVTQRFDYLLMQ